MGADRAGGDWDIVVEMLEFFSLINSLLLVN